MKPSQLVLGLLRIALGLTFLWAFLDKMFGLGFATCRDAKTNEILVMCEKAWMNGGSPTAGFLGFGTHGPFVDFYQSLTGSSLVDWLFMLGLLGVGVALTAGILMRLAIFSGIFMMALMYTAALPPENNPLIDEHVIYALLLILFIYLPVGEWLGFGKQWARSSFAKQYFWLR